MLASRTVTQNVLWGRMIAKFLINVLSADGRLDQAAKPSPERAKVAARGRSSESDAKPGRGPHVVANVGGHDYKQGKRGRLQQQA